MAKLKSPPCPTCGAYSGHQRHAHVLPSVPSSDLLLRQTFEKLSALFIKLHNLQVEVQELRTSVIKTSTLFSALVDDPESRAFAEAQLKKFIQERNQ